MNDLKLDYVRELTITGEINEESASKFIYEFLEIVRRDSDIVDQNKAFTETYQAKVEPYQLSPIRINIMSYGGSVEAFLAMADVLDESVVPIHIHALGYCMSSAFALYLKGDIRTAGVNTQFMFHGTHGGCAGGTCSQRANVEYGEKLERMVFQDILDKTKYTQVDIDNSMLANRYIGYDEAVEMGIVNYDTFNHKGSLNKAIEAEEQVQEEVASEGPKPRKPKRRFVK